MLDVSVPPGMPPERARYVRFNTMCIALSNVLQVFLVALIEWAVGDGEGGTALRALNLG